jgi:uncharacterized protein DUF4440
MGRLAGRILILACTIALATLGQRSARADDRAEATAAESALVLALASSNKAAAAGLLDDAFTWTAADGQTRDKTQALDHVDDIVANTKNETDLEGHLYGRVLTQRGSHDKLRFLRIWVKRDTGWRLYLLLETPVAPRAGPASVEAAAGQGDCDNPCRSVPYEPQTAMDKAILAAWQATKMIEWKPDADAWARYIADEFMIINNTTIRTRAERVAIARKQQAAGVGAPGDPIVTMEIHDFGDDAAVMISHHVPYRGGKPYRNVRVWVLRDGRWQLAISQQSVIQAAAPVAAVGAKK